MTGRTNSAKLPRRELEEVREVDPDGRVVLRHRTVDTLGRMRRSETISAEMYDAARDFQANFALANLDPIRARPVTRVRATWSEPDLNERQIEARRRVHAALQALGGINSPAGSCLWHVVGLQRSLREWASRQAGVGGRCARSRRRASWWRRWGY